MTSQDPGAKAPGQFRMILKYKATSFKRQAPSAKPRPALMMPQLKNKIKIERNKL